MLNKDATKEFEEINKYKSTLENIPNYKKYFIIADDLCKPDELTKDDVVDINEKCDKYSFLANFYKNHLNQKVFHLFKYLMEETNYMNITLNTIRL